MALGSLLSWWYFAPDRDFERLLQGNEDVAIVSIEVHRARYCTVNDPAAARYLSQRLRFSQKAWGGRVGDAHFDAAEFYRGESYDVSWELSTGRVAESALHVSRAQDRIMLVFPLDTFGDPDLYVATLTKPVPKALADAILREPPDD
jgi:hypothetical protein